MRSFGTPVGDIIEASNRVADGDFATRLNEDGPRPVRIVARAFNSMTTRLQAQDAQRRHLMADIAHELRNPLAVLQGRLEGMLDGVYPRDGGADCRRARGRRGCSRGWWTICGRSRTRKAAY